MSNEMSLFTSGAAIPAHIAKRELSETTKALMGGGGASESRRISVRGNIFRLTVGGQEIAKNEDRAMNIIIAAAAPKTSRTYYSATYQEGVAVSPDCWSADGDHPSSTIAQPESVNCATCTKNIAGSGQGTSRACRYTHRLAVLLENDITGNVYELTLAATSLFGKGENGKLPLFQYAKQLATHGMNVTDVVTELRFDTDSATPKMVFRAVRPLEVSELEAVLDKGASLEAIQAVTTSFQPAKTDARPAKSNSAPQGFNVAEPTVRESKKTTGVPAAAPDLASALQDWAD